MYRSIKETADCTDLVAVQPPVLQLLLEERPADVSGVVELAGSVIVQDLAEHSRVSVTESLARVSGETSPAIWKVCNMLYILYMLICIRFDDNQVWKTTVWKLIATPILKHRNTQK